MSDSKIKTAFQSDEQLKCPYSYYADLRENAPVYQVPGRDIFLISRYDDVAAVYRDHASFSSMKNPHIGDETMVELANELQAACPIAPAVVDNDPPGHTALRYIISRAFTHARLTEYQPLIREVTLELIEKFAARGSCEFVSEFATQLPMMVICRILGLPLERMEEFKIWSDTTINFVHSVDSHEHARTEMAYTLEMRRYLVEVLEVRRRNPGPDVLSELATSRLPDGELIPMPELLNMSWLLLVAGNETTAYMIANAMCQLGKNPDLLARVASDTRLIPKMLEEVLRIESSSQTTNRIATRDVEFHGVTIPKGSTVIVFRGGANHDDTKFDDPDDFDIDRPNVRQHLAFGSGIHACIGSPLARLQGRIAYEMIFEMLHDIRLTNKDDVRYVRHTQFRCPEALNLTFTPVA